MPAGQNSVIVFYSRHGTTRLAARLLAARGAALVELRETHRGNVFQALLHCGSKLEGKPWREIEQALYVYLLLPIWASNSVPAMNAFLRRADFSGKQVFIVTFQQSRFFQGSGKVHQYIAEQVEKTNGTVRARSALLGALIGRRPAQNEVELQLPAVPELF
jgi:flavodoxin